MQEPATKFKDTTHIRKGVCMSCRSMYSWADGDPYDGETYCECQCPECGTGLVWGYCENCTDEPQSEEG